MIAQNLANFFTRASAGWYYNSAGVLTQASTNTPRFDYDPVAKTVRGLLIEEARTNKCTNRNANPVDLTGINSSSNVTVTVVDDAAELALAGLSGVCSSGKVYKATRSGAGIWVITTGATGNTNQHTSSVFLRTVGTTVRVGVNGAFGTGVSAAHYTRVASTVTPGSSAATFEIDIDTDGGSVYFVLNQLEEGAFATSPIVVAGAQVTRSADLCQIPTGTAWFTGVSGTLYAEFIPSLGVDQTLVSVANVLNGNDSLRLRKTSSNVSTLVNRAGGTVYDITSAAVPSGTSKIAAAFKSGDEALCLNGGAVVTSANTISSLLNNFVIGGNTSMGASPGTGWLREVRYYPYRMTNAAMQTLTT